ncbi:lipoyl(octanoyl) transferase LipB [Salinivibrio sp. ES.052]|uniref:lipoyl(octanoyl) transferase LipB n=1 Tax=Salinivibrio sp. ES.052 TaxID=1882823 RepID=UPI0011150D4E|nr:lipoyl(octanoyl) transferase LipB [Salinivibrio sp. ES.052]
MQHQLVVRHLGRQPYLHVWEQMRDFTNTRDEQTLDEIWLVEHDPVFTQGQAGKTEHVLVPGEIPVVQSDRGGQVTYHGPGQLVVYFLINLKRKKVGVRELVSHIEDLVIGTLAHFHVDANARPDAPGVYVDGAKICSLGLRIRRGCSFHGLALNINMDLSPFQRINPCGYAGMAMTQLSDQVENVTLADVQPVLVDTLTQQLSYSQVEFTTESSNL